MVLFLEKKIDIPILYIPVDLKSIRIIRILFEWINFILDNYIDFYLYVGV